MTDNTIYQHDRKKSLPWVTLIAALLVLVLAFAAVLFPDSGGYNLQGVFLVFDGPHSGPERQELFESICSVLEDASGQSMNLVVVNKTSEFFKEAQKGVDFVLCPDGLALQLAQDDFGLLVCGRRKLPDNLRPRGVVVSRADMSEVKQPWMNHARRTVFGDSLSLVSLGSVNSQADLSLCSFGPDPYDHRPVLHALRLGAFDFACVRQWDADSFFRSGLLDPKEWIVKDHTDPVPDLVVMASRKIPLVERLKWADSLALLGRSGENSEDPSLKSQNIHHLIEQLGAVGLTGFNILLEPDFELVRRKFSGDWPPEGK
ncbi:MAG: hypothetical protein GY780_13650 [bacterium]|nr:hypothetical protein [bacterium]